MRLVFVGKAWPAAQQNSQWTSLITTSGQGRTWRTTTALGWWRTFAEIDTTNTGEAVAFIRRYGDPTGRLEASEFTDLADWPRIQSVLRPFAGAWTTGADGIDRAGGALKVDADSAARVRIVGGGFELHFSTLGDFMIGSAADMFARGASMRRCEVCGAWFEIQRSTGRICSASCKTAKRTRRFQSAPGTN